MVEFKWMAGKSEEEKALWKEMYIAFFNGEPIEQLRDIYEKLQTYSIKESTSVS